MTMVRHMAITSVDNYMNSRLANHIRQRHPKWPNNGCRKRPINIIILCRQLRQIKSPYIAFILYAYTVYAHNIMFDYIIDYLSVIIGE